MVVLGFETNVAIIQSSMSIIVCFQKLPVRRTPDSFLTNVSAYICKITSCTRSDLFGPNGISELWRLGFKRGGQVPCCRAGCGPDPELDMPTILGELEFCLSAQMGPSTSAMLGGHYGHFTTLSEGGPSLSRCGTLHSAVQCCTVSHSATAWVQKSGIADAGVFAAGRIREREV